MPTGLKERLETAKTAQETGLSTTNGQGSVLGWLNAPTTASELARALPAGMDSGRFARVVQTELRKNPELLKCTPQTFILAVLNAAQLGLEPGPLGHSYLVPFRNSKINATECTLLLGYKGLKELAYRGGAVDFIDAVSVHEGEPFRIVRQPDPHLEHEELPGCAGSPVVAYYAFAVLKDSGRVVFEVMWPADVDGIRKRSRAKDSGPWVTDFEAMALKTVTRRLLNRGKVRLSAQIAEAIHEDEARELGFDRPEMLASLAPAAPPAKETKKSKETPAAAGGGGAESVEATDQDAGQPETTPTEPPSAAPADPTKDPAVPGSILKDPPAAADPGAAFRRNS